VEASLSYPLAVLFVNTAVSHGNYPHEPTSNVPYAPYKMASLSKMTQPYGPAINPYHVTKASCAVLDQALLVLAAMQCDYNFQVLRPTAIMKAPCSSVDQRPHSKEEEELTLR